MTQQMYPARDRGLRRVVLITTALAAAGLVGTGAAAVLAHADSTATTTKTTTNTSNTTNNTSNTSNTNTDSGVSAGTGSAPQAQSAGS